MSNIKAYTLHGIDQLVYNEVEMPACPDGWAIVKVKAAGICSSDISRIFTKGTYHFPTIPGHEFSGVVECVGNSSDAFWVGKKVGIFPLIPCKECTQCQQQQYEMCENYDYVGSRRDGGFAEYVAVPVWNLIQLGENTSFVDAAMMEPLAVALHAMKRAQVKAGDTVAIIGTGMIGFAAAQWSKMLGARSVHVIGRSQGKRVLAEKLPGIDYVVDCDVPENQTYSVVLEAVGSVDAIRRAICIAQPGGRVVLMGNPASDITLPQNVYWRVLRKQLTLIGTWNSAYSRDGKSDWDAVSKALEDRQVEVSCLVSHIFSQDQLMDGLELMRNNKEPYCKVMSLWNHA